MVAWLCVYVLVCLNACVLVWTCGRLVVCSFGLSVVCSFCCAVVCLCCCLNGFAFVCWCDRVRTRVCV